MQNILNVLIAVVSFLNPIECCQSKSVEISPQSLPIPLPKYLDVRDPAHIIVKWDPVRGSQDNPILGFKVKLWEDQKELVTKHVNKDGQLVEVKEWVPVKQTSDTIPTHKPAFEAVIPPDVFQASFDVKLGEHYDLRAQSYNAAGDGPLSDSFGFKIHTTEETERIERERREKEQRDKKREEQVLKELENTEHNRNEQKQKIENEKNVKEQIPEEKGDTDKTPAHQRKEEEEGHTTHKAAKKRGPPPRRQVTVKIIDTNVYDYIDYLKSQQNDDE